VKHAIQKGDLGCRLTLAIKVVTTIVTTLGRVNDV
jgi:hypothetical protein